MVSLKVIASTVEGVDNNTIDLYKLGGKIAGVCYMDGEYSDSKISSDEAGLRRAKMTANNGHHSVFDHVYKTVEFKGIPKLMAMVLNSMGAYNTSEKSGRYTRMSGNTDEEMNLYNKWLLIYSSLIGEEYKGLLTSKEVEKLAQENARYVLDVNTETSMVYTASLRQWCYIVDWLLRLSEEISGYSGELLNNYNYQLMLNSKVLSEMIRDKLGLDGIGIHDIKSRKVSLFSDKKPLDYYGDVYITSYKGSFVQLAQAQRNRTLKYKMIFNGKSSKYYVPKILRGTGYEDEWLEDMREVSKVCVPQGTLISIIEMGDVESFILKAKERLCGRAQLEVREQTANTLLKLAENNSIMLIDELTGYIGSDGKVKNKCEVKGNKCVEGCKFKNIDRRV